MNYLHKIDPGRKIFRQNTGRPMVTMGDERRGEALSSGANVELS